MIFEAAAAETATRIRFLNLRRIDSSKQIDIRFLPSTRQPVCGVSEAKPGAAATSRFFSASVMMRRRRGDLYINARRHYRNFLLVFTSCFHTM